VARSPVAARRRPQDDGGQFCRVFRHFFGVGRRADGNPSIEVDKDGAGDGAFDGHFGLIALEHDPRKRLEYMNGRSRGDAKRRQALGASGQVAYDPGDTSACAW
jgi:hypothetical protein